MITKELSEAAVEFNCILNNSSQEIIDKIPKKFITFMQSIASSTYTFNYDKSKKLNEQNLKPETRGLISLIYSDYICNEEEKNNYTLKCKDYEAKKEKELREKYNPDNLFKSEHNNIQSVDNLSITEETSVIKYKEKKFIEKIFHKIISVLKKFNI